MDWMAKFEAGLDYHDFLARYAQPAHRARWDAVYEAISLSEAQRQLLASFRRDMNVLCLAGAWCGDCVNQCPMFERVAETTPNFRLRFLDRDDHADVQQELMINGGKRVPVLVFISEDGYEVARYGERTLSQYRRLVQDNLGPECLPGSAKGFASYEPGVGAVSQPRPTGLVAPPPDLRASVLQDWLDEIERVQWLLRLSARLRQKHGD